MRKIFFICFLFACNLLFAIDYPKGDLELYVGDAIETPFEVSNNTDRLNFIKGRITSVIPYGKNDYYIVKIYNTAEKIEYELYLTYGASLYTRDYFVYLGFLEPYDSRSKDDYKPYYIRIRRINNNSITISYRIIENLEKD